MIAGFGFNKMSVEKFKAPQGKIDINNNVSIKDLKEDTLPIGKDKDNGVSVLKFIFEFTSKYEPEIGIMVFEGEILYMENPKKIKEILSSWNKTKQIPKEIMAGLLNTILTKCNVKALILSQDVNLPSPIPLPKVQMSQGDKSYIG